jgi:hypothetical protein
MNASKFIDMIAILKQHSQLEILLKQDFKILEDYKLRTPQRLISSSRERQSHSCWFS